MCRELVEAVPSDTRDCSSNPVIGKSVFTYYQLYWKEENKEDKKRQKMAQFTEIRFQTSKISLSCVVHRD